VETARELYNQGRNLRDHGDLAGALEKLKAAYSLARTPITGLELARTHVALGQPLEAREICLNIARMPVASEETARSGAARTEAAALAEEARAKIATLGITLLGVPPNGAPTLVVDGSLVPVAALAEPRKLNPGAHTIAARMGSGAEITEKVELGEGETRTVSMTLIAPTAPAEPSTRSTPEPIAPTPAAERLEPRLSPYVIPSVVVTALGVAVGAVAGGRALAGKSDLQSKCPGSVCGPDAHDDLQSAKLMGTVSTIAFIVAAGGAVFAIYGFTHPTYAPQPRSTAKRPLPSIEVHPALGMGSLGIHGTF
jgi:hypothetical protein